MVWTLYLLPPVLLGVELDEGRGTDCDSDFTIRGRLMSLVEKVAYVKNKIESRPKQKKDRKASEFLQVLYIYVICLSFLLRPYIFYYFVLFFQHNCCFSILLCHMICTPIRHNFITI